MSADVQKEALNNSVAKAVTILNCFSYERPRLRLKDIAAMTGINQATAYRMLNTLKEYNLIEQLDGTYSLGKGFLKYEGIVLNSMEIRRIGLPLLEDLSNTLKVNANLAVLDENEVVYIARAETSYCAYGYFHIGMRRPIHCTALGKVLVCRTPEIAREVFKRGVKQYTLTTITDETEYLKEIEQVRLQGYAMDREEWSNGINCIAAPLYDVTGEIVAGISISGPTSTYPEEKIQEYVPLLIDYSHRISARLGSDRGW
ncbi:IclR family transcriptional regulator [Sporomusa acidovorans]|uniref:Transcriptional regulator KdgR n=1 Tax=Sporomusa acidovorans (strain ATCC 49682 / DSM 3132 / Mol) TaxID=1123286 RepID=A0ABZ3J5R3_SPOA4|nr:IclR family transcriptional regulator [Sporomusa acidovorans]OZC24211.1 transcriptional regulator KdgR [Sporomusa acidovorans DSM 3132]SDF77280.1 transcriptional regulator, IclR family [Sporomusa acidovorans]